MSITLSDRFGRWQRLCAKALLLRARVTAIEATWGQTIALVGRLAMLGGALAASAPALGQLWHLEVLAAAQTLGHAAVMAGLAASLGGRR